MTIAIHTALMERHQAMQAQLASQPDALETETILQFIEEARAAGARIADVRQREQLRAILRHWGGIIYDQTGEYPAIQLAPFDGQSISELPHEDKPVQSIPGWGRLIAIGAGVGLILFILIALAAVFGLRLGGGAAAETDPTVAVNQGVTEPASGEDTPSTATPIPGATFLPPTETATPQTAVPHTVQAGETLETIAGEYGVLVTQLANINDLALQDRLQVGQQIFVPLNPGFIIPELVIKISAVNLHSGPGIEYPILAQPARGTFATILGQTFDPTWYNVDLQDSRGTRGWLSAAEVRLLYPTRPETIPLVATVPPTPTQ
jgi:LysM repeat protein